VALTDPELDLLVEMLTEDPEADVFLEVGAELVRRGRWTQAEEVLVGGLGAGPAAGDADPTGWALLARAALELGHLDRAAEALGRIDRDPAKFPEHARVEILVFERAGRRDDARAAAERFLAVDPGDVVVASVIERLAAPPPDPHRRGADPLITADRAEAYARAGRPDRAVRAYRRILLAHPDDVGIQVRLAELSRDPTHRPDDLSEELTDPGLVPPEPIDMPSPRTGPSSAVVVDSPVVVASDPE
jgi:tetratricopeptide (TPR) repeat protein